MRAKLGLTQRQLADMVGTSQQQIQRVESGQTAARLSLAVAIAAALEKPLNVVFPGSVGALVKAVGDLDVSQRPADDELDHLHQTGVEWDSAEHCLRVWMRGHAEAIYFPLSPHEKRRLFQAIQGEVDDAAVASFVVFDSWDKRVAINLAELSACQFLFEPMEGSTEFDSSAVSEPLNSEEVFVFQGGTATPVTFKPVVDRPEVADEEGLGEFGDIFSRLEMNLAPSERLHFQDRDGESVFLRVGSLALLSVPLWVVEPAKYPRPAAGAGEVQHG